MRGKGGDAPAAQTEDDISTTDLWTEVYMSPTKGLMLYESPRESGFIPGLKKDSEREIKRRLRL